jgi:hypothetical protein
MGNPGLMEQASSAPWIELLKAIPGTVTAIRLS